MASQSESLLFAWAKALKAETAPALIGAFSFASTILTFIPSIGLGHIRSISLACLAAAFIWANVRVFGKHRAAISDLQASLCVAQEKRARLVIHEGDRTRYIVVRKSDQCRDGAATYIEFDMVVENKGERHSNIYRYDLAIREIGNYQNIKPHERNTVLGRNADYQVQRPFLMSGGYVGVEPEKMTPRAYLPFWITEPPPKDCGPLHCTLTITDTEGNSASHNFVVGES